MKTPFTPLIESLPAYIPFVAPETIERKRGIRFTTRIGANESVFGISPKARAAIENSIDSISCYSDPEWGDLREAIADKHQVHTENISVGAGIDDLLGLAVRVFLTNRTAAVASLGSYGVFHYHLDGYGVKCITTPYLNDGFNNLEALAKLAHGNASPMVYLSNPDNPAGTCYSAKDIQAFINKLPIYCMVVIDEAYIDFAPEGTALSINDLDPRVLQMRTFSKAHGLAGSRIGYVIASKEVVQAFDKVRLHFNVNRIAQAAALGSLQDPEFIQGVVEQVAVGRSEYEGLAKDLGLNVIPSSTNFVNFDAGNQVRAQAILDQLIQHGIFIRKPGAPPLDRYFRITVGTPEQRQHLASVLPQVIAEVDSVLKQV
ncbi:MAG: aminotransferase class I/II-fold pyridoxal phosphate-dependent enzyme [Opitutales bacterium]|jgi:histidinol-phosphate aminotransferase|nr:aminotransferase class I/II-fold pyridoxal phosphate-dependent enzyme [Opitutales bacterium]